ncbi:uncharacterized protein LOC135834552 [Planococcus citri]|uniref:uncharacterized protein LOC135834552 n=1 Tax=Planococcus citri TaxID=170843 RepID=UPI0031F76514
MGFKIGPIKKIIRIKNSIQSISPVDTSEADLQQAILLNNQFKVIDKVPLNGNDELPEENLLLHMSQECNRSLYFIGSSTPSSGPTSQSSPTSPGTPSTASTPSPNTAQSRSSMPSDPEESDPLKTVDVSSIMSYPSIKEALLGHPKGPPILEAINNGQFDERCRRVLVRILTSELVKHCGNYPSDEQKYALAQALVEAFPELRCDLSTIGCEQYFDPVTKKGFISYRLENMRKNLAIGEKKYAKRKKKLSQENTDADTITLSISENEILQKIELMNNTLPNVANKASIEKNMFDTFHARREWIHRPNEDVSKQPTVLEIVDKFPRIIDYNGELMEKEYQRMTENGIENSNGLLTVFPVTYTKRILEYCKANSLPLYEDLIKDDDLRALALLIGLLPRSNFATKRKANENVTRSSNSFPMPQFLIIKPNGISIEEELAKMSSECTQQAFILAVETKFSKYVYFLVSDAKPVPLAPETSALAAVTALRQFHYVFNIEYAKELKFFYNFIDCVVMNRKSMKILPSVRSLNVSLLNFKV